MKKLIVAMIVVLLCLAAARAETDAKAMKVLSDIQRGEQSIDHLKVAVDSNIGNSTATTFAVTGAFSAPAFSSNMSTGVLKIVQFGGTNQLAYVVGLITNVLDVDVTK